MTKTSIPRLGRITAVHNLPRLMQAMAGGAPAAYEASGNGVRMMNWPVADSGPNAVLTGNMGPLVRRSRDMLRKNPWARRAIDRYVANVIGTGIKPRSTHPNADIRRALHDSFERFSDQCDVDGATNYYGQQVMTLTAALEGGDGFARFRPRRREDGLRIPLQIQLLEAEMVPFELTEARGPNIIRAGIEFDALGRRRGYHMLRHHPSDMAPVLNTGLPVFVPRDVVSHVYKPLRPGQVRGVPQLAQVLLPLYELDQYTDAELVRKKVQAMITGFITKSLGDDTPPPLGPEGQFAGAAPSGTELVDLQPGTFPVLNWGEDVKFSQPTDIGAGTNDFVKYLLRYVAAGTPLTFEQLTGDTSDANYSTFRGMLLEFRREVEMFQACFFVHQFCKPTWRQFIIAAVLAGDIDFADYRDHPDWYGCRWVPHGFKWVDPLKEVQALVKAIRAGLISRTDAAQLSGFDAEIIDAQMAEDNVRADAAGLAYDSDGRRSENPSAQGAASVDASSQDDDDDDGEQTAAARSKRPRD